MADAAVKNDVQIEEAGPCLRKLTITIPGEAVSEQIDSSMSLVAESAALPGFRPGRVPRRLIEKKFGADVKREARSQLISSAYSQAIEDNDLEVLGDPAAPNLDEIELEPGEPVTVTLEVEVAPQFELPELEGLAVKKPLIEVTDERIDASIERMALNEGELEQQDEPQPGDYLIGHGVMREKDAGDDAEPLLDLQGAVVRVPEENDDGEGMILGIVVDDFATQLGLPKPGETASVECVGPEHHEKEAVRGKDVRITFDVDQVQRIMPASTEGLCSKFGFSEESQLRDAVRQRLEYRIAVEQQSAMRQQVAKHLLDSVDFELPERVSAQQAGRLLQRAALDMQHRGVDQTVIEQRLAELRSQSQERARRELKLFFILARVAKQLDVQVQQEEVMGRIAQMAASRGQRPEKLRDQLVQSGQINMLAQQVREHKALDALLERANIEELSVEEFNKQMQGEEGVETIDEAGEE
jgi:trigger factor